MIEERSVFLEGKMFKAVISDELFLLREAMEAGKAVIGLEDGKDQPGSVHLYGIPYVILSMEDATPVFVERVVRRHAGLPWEICRTKRLLIRELTPEDASQIPAEEYAAREAVFRDRASLACYCQNQYPFYEYGTWALVGRDDGCLVGLAGVNNPRLPEEMEAVLEGRQGSEENQMPWLEIGYHIFRPYRQMGYCREALEAIAAYSHEELGARLCALILALSIRWDNKLYFNAAIRNRVFMTLLPDIVQPVPMLLYNVIRMNLWDSAVLLMPGRAVCCLT